MAHIKVTRRGTIRVDAAAAGHAAGAAIVAQNQKRVAESRDVDDVVVAGYSDLYRQQLASINKPFAPGARLAELLRGLKVIRMATSTGGKLLLEFGVDGTVVSTPRPPPWVFDRNKSAAQRAAAFARWQSSTKKVETHEASLVLGWLAGGTADRRARRLLGVSPRDRAEVIKAIERAPIFRST